MADPIFWTNVGVDVQTAIGDAVTIESISKATEGLVTYDGTDPAVDAAVLIEAAGMNEVHQRVFYVKDLDTGAKTFKLDSEDTTDYSTFTSGTFRVVTYGASMNTAQTVNASGGDAEFTDITTIHDIQRKRAPGVTSPLSFTLTNFLDKDDPAVKEMRKAYMAKRPRAVRFRFGTSLDMLFYAYCTATGAPTGQAQGAVTTPTGFEAQGAVTWV